MTTGALPIARVFRIRSIVVDAKTRVTTRSVSYTKLFSLIAILEPLIHIAQSKASSVGADITLER